MKKRNLFPLLICIFSLNIVAVETEHFSTGNLAVNIPPSITFGFGQNIFKKHSFVPYAELNQLAKQHGSSVQLTPAVIYAFTDAFSLFAGLPIILEQQNGNVTQRGIGNLFAQGEYALFNRISTQAQTNATLVGAIAFPTTNLSDTYDYQLTNTTVAPANIFVGATASHTTPRWYGYASLGATVYAKQRGIRPGSSFLYEGAIGTNLGNPWGIAALGLIEGDGIYTQKDWQHHVSDPTTGGNTFYLGPSICLSGNRWLISGGIQAPVMQHLNGTQAKARFRSLFTVLILF